MATVHKVNILTELDAKNAQATAEKLHKTIKATKEEAASISAGGGKALAAAYKGSTSLNQLTEYGQTRAMRPGGTGASARDFAQEAQGLGGLVRLYATYAANVFAVSAAFNALSAAQDTANMVKGLDQLGASSGMALGRLSKDLVKATDGAISLREAMEATVKASSSGMVAKDIMRMGEVAKKASLALGVNMLDAMSRLSRGITKLEPELLDELGIFTRIDPAVQAYARLVGKSVTDLTEFERRMAFTNAVLKEGEEKFGAINISANGYTQLLSKLKDAATSIGNALNTVLTPIVTLLLQSPMALYGVIAGLAGMVLKQAVPALGSLRESMVSSTQETIKNATNRIEQFKLAQQNIIKELLSGIENLADSSVNKWDTAVKKFRALQLQLKGNALLKKDEELNRILSIQAVQDVLKADLDYLDQRIKSNVKLSGAIKEVRDGIVELQQLHAQYLTQKEQEIKKAEVLAQKLIQYRANKKLELDAQASLVRAEITNRAQEVASIQGFRASIDQLGKDIKKARLDGQMTMFGAALTAVAGGFRAATAAAAGFVAIAAPWLEFLVLGYAAILFIIGASAKASREVEAFGAAMDSALDYAKTFRDTLDGISKKDIIGQNSIKSIEAILTSLVTLADGLDTVSSKAEQAKKAIAEGSISDKLVEGFKDLFDFGVNDKQVDAFTDSINSILISIDKAPTKLAPLEKLLSQALGGINIRNARELEKALEGVVKDPAAKALLVKQIKDLGIELGNTASKLKGIVAGFDSVNQNWKDFAKNFDQKDPLSKFAQDAQDNILKLLKEIDGPGGLSGSMEAVLKATELAKSSPLFGNEATQDLISYTERMRELSEEVKKLSTEREKAEKKLAEANSKVPDRPAELAGTASRSSAMAAGTQQQLNARQYLPQKQVTTEIRDARAAVQDILMRQLRLVERSIEKTAEAGGDRVKESLITGFLRSSQILGEQMELALKKGLATFTLGVLSLLNGPNPAAATREAELKNNDIGIQIKQLETQRDMLLESKKIALLQEKIANLAVINAAQDKTTPEAQKKAKDRNDVIDKLLLPKIQGLGNTNNLKFGKTDSNMSYEEAAAAAEFGAVQRMVQGIRAEIAQLGAQAALNTLQGKIKSIDEMYKVLLDDLNLREKVLKTEQAQLQAKNALKQLGTLALLDEEERLLQKQESLDLDKQEIEYEKAALQYQELLKTGKLTETEKAYERLALQRKAAAIVEADAQVQAARDQRQATIQDKTTKYYREVEDMSKQVLQTEIDILSALADHLNSITELKFKQLEINDDLGLRTKELANQRAEYEKISIAAETELKARKLTLDYDNKITTLKRQLADEPAANAERVAQLKAQIAGLEQLKAIELKNIEEIKAARLAVIEAEKEARENALRNSIADTLADSIAEAIFEGGKAGMASLKDTIKSAFKESITSALKQNLRGLVGGIMSAIVGAFGGTASAGPSAGAGGVAGGGGAMGSVSLLVAVGKEVFAGISSGLNFASTFGTAITRAGYTFGNEALKNLATGFGAGMLATSSMANFTAAISEGGLMMAGAIAGTLLNGLSGYGISKAISGGYTTGGNTVNTIAAIALMIPGIGPIAGIIGGVINRAFGRKLKDVGIEGKFGGEAGFTGKNYQFYKGGWLRSDKTKYSDMDSESQKSFAQQFRNIQLSTMLTAGSLNIANKDNLAAVSNYSKDIKLSTQGLSKEDAIAKVQEEFDKIADDMAKAFLTTTVTTTESVKKMVEETKNMGDDLVTTYREVTEEVTTSTLVLRDDLPRWMQAIVDLEGPTAAALEKIKEYPIQALQQFGIARDALVDTFAEGLMTGRGRQAGQLVANQIVQSIEKLMYTNAAGQIFDIMNQGIITPILHAALTGQSVQAAITDAAINATIERAQQAANALAAIFKDEKFKTLLNTIKDGLGKVLGDLSIDFEPARFQSLPTTFEDLDTTAEEASDSVDELTEKLRDLAKASITNLFDDLVSTLKKMGDTVKSNIKKVQDFRKSLVEFKEKLLLGDKLNLTAAEKYSLSKTTFETTLQKALQGDETAISKLTSASEAFLSESRNFYSSGEQYTQDFNRVLSVLETVDTAAATLEQQLNDELKDINTNLLTLGSIDTTLDSIYVVLEKGLGTVGGELVNLMDKLGINQASVQNLVQNGLATTEQANLLLKAVDKNGNGLFDKEELVHLRNIGANTNLTSTATKVPTADTTAAASAAGISTYGADQIVKVGNENFVYSGAGAIAMQTGSNWTLQLRDGTRVTLDRVAELLKTEGVAMFQAGQHEALYNVFKQAGLSSAVVLALSGVSQQDLLGWAAANGLPAFATGINYVPYDMPAMIHEGERIFPKADNEELMKSIKSSNNAELVYEIRRLNDKVASLERTVAQGAAANAQATDRNTDAVVHAVTNSTDRAIQSNSIKERATLK